MSAVRRPSQLVLGTAAVIATTAALYVALLATYLGPLNGFWSSDQGVKLIQTQSLLLNRYRDSALRYPGAPFDPQGQASPLRGQYLERGGRAYAMFSEAFAALSGVPFFLLGYPGLYVVPVAATLLLLAACAAIGRHMLTTPWTLGVLVVLAAASPLMFYSLIFWEHTLAVLLVTLALLATAEALRRDRPRLLLAAGACIGLAAWFRNESALALPALALAILIDRGPRTEDHHPEPLVFGHSSLVRLAWLGAGAAVGAAPLLIFNWLVFGTPLGPHVLVAGRANDLQVAPGLGGMLDARRAWADMLLAPLNQPLVLLALLALLALALAARIAGRRGRTLPAMWLYAAAALLMGLGLALQAPRARGIQTALLITFPPVLLCLLPAPMPGERTLGARLARVLVWFGVASIALAWLARLPDGGAQWGPRMLLPALPALALAGAARAAAWLRRGPGPAFAVAAAAATLVNIAALSQIDGLRQLRAFNTSNHQILTTVAQSGERAVIADTWYAPPLLAPLFYDGRLVFLVDGGDDLDTLLGRLEAGGITGFYYLGTRADELAAESGRWPALVPLDEPRRLPHNLVGVRYRLAPEETP